MQKLPEQMTPHVEFDCVDCRQHIVALSLIEVPADRRCATCRHLVEFVPDEGERDAMRARLLKEPKERNRAQA